MRFQGLISVLCVGICWGCGSTSGTRDGGPDPSEWGRVEAGPRARSFGVARYEISVSTTPEPRIRVVLLSREGATFGAVTMYGDGRSGLVAEYAGHDGDTALYRVSASIAADVFTVRTSIEARGRALESDAIGRRDAAAIDDPGGPWLQTVVLSTILPVGSTAPGIGGASPDLTGDRASIVVQQGGVEVTDRAAVAEWIGAVGLAPLASSPSATILSAVVQDPALSVALEERIASMAPQGTSLEEGRRSEALHLTARCAPFYGRMEILPATARTCCSECEPVSPLEGETPLGSLTVLACQCCTAAIVLNGIDLLACLRAWSNTEIFDDARCQSERPCERGLVSRMTADGHGCECVCDVDMSCQPFCDQITARNGIPNEGFCRGANTCACLPNLDAFCAIQFGSGYCGGAQIELEVPLVVRCPNRRCGDLHRTDASECIDGTSEVCDPSARNTNCPGGELCAADCSACQPCPAGCSTCRCTPGVSPSGCPADYICSSSCQCEPVPSCATSLVSLVTSERWCDPREAGWCPQGTVCTAETCQCTYCGDGTVNGSEECEAGFAGGECPAGQPCNDCRCGSNCGNGTVDPGEHCDPAGGAPCDRGYSCMGCTCVAAQCGDGICDRSAGEDEGSCGNDCPAACGDGVCNTAAGENSSASPSHCPGDCPEVQCCFDTNGCPSEQLYECPGDCCCCGAGARCVRPQGVWVCGI